MRSWFYEIAMGVAASAAEYAVERYQRFSDRKKKAEKRRKEQELADKLERQLNELARQADEIVKRLEGFEGGDKKIR